MRDDSSNWGFLPSWLSLRNAGLLTAGVAGMATLSSTNINDHLDDRLFQRSAIEALSYAENISEGHSIILTMDENTLQINPVVQRPTGQATGEAEDDDCIVFIGDKDFQDGLSRQFIAENSQEAQNLIQAYEQTLSIHEGASLWVDLKQLGSTESVSVSVTYDSAEFVADTLFTNDARYQLAKMAYEMLCLP